MENFYSREFMSSSQLAAKLVFNIENCVDLSRVLHQRPTRPPDPQGREAFVYIMDGSVIRSIKDLTIDDLSPWNSKKCKSSTRFSSVQFDNERNSLIFNRFIISDSSNDFKPDCLFACYYCKHPVFDLVKKIFYACDGSRERCLPGTFVIFVYEFNRAERLYKTQRYQPQPNPNLTSALNSIGSSIKASPNHSSLASSSSATLAQTANFSPPMNHVQRHFLESSSHAPPLKLEHLNDWMGEDGQQQGGGGFDLDGFLSSEGIGGADEHDNPPSGTTCLEDILRSCTEAVQQQQQQQQQQHFNGANSSISHDNSILDFSSTFSLINAAAPALGDPQQRMSMSSTGSSRPPEKKRRKITFHPVALLGDGKVTAASDMAMAMHGRRNQQQPPTGICSQQSSSPSSLTPVDGSPFVVNDEQMMTAGCSPLEDSKEDCKQQFRHFYTSEALLENFRKNCLCNGKQLGERLDELDELFMKEAAAASSAAAGKQSKEKMEEILQQQGETPGGCLLVDSAFSVGPPGQRLCFLWFRNPTFVHRRTHQPTIHPVAVLMLNQQDVNNAHHQQQQQICSNVEQQQNLLNELTNRLEAEAKRGRICRSIIFQPPNDAAADSLATAAASTDELDHNSRWSSLLDSELCSFPCVRLVPVQQFRHWLRHKFSQLSGIDHEKRGEKTGAEETAEEAQLLARIETELLGPDTGVLQSLTFEQFVQRQRAVERGWPNAFRLWFREKSGWLFERCSLSARLKAGFGHGEVEEEDPDQAMEPMREEVRQVFAAALQPGDGQPMGMGMEFETAVEAVELICNDFLRRALNALLDPIDEESTDESGILPANPEHWIGRTQWEQLSNEEKRAKLSPLGLSSLLCLSDSLDPALFFGMDRTQKRELLSRANCLTVLEAADGTQKTESSSSFDVNGGGGAAEEQPKSGSSFVTVDRSRREANFVQLLADGEEEALYCQCRGGIVIGPLCEHILAVALKHSHFAKRIPMPPPPMMNGQQQQQQVEDVNLKFNGANNNGNNNNLPSVPGGLQMDGTTQSDEIICCGSSDGSSC